ncbi:MAG TPA: hypothetical protein VGH82_10435 [Gaiellaceae bacterium]|jgi:hypothetical protein
MPIESQGRTFIRLKNGDQIILTEDEADRVFDELWLLAPRMKGAVTAAAKLKRAHVWALFHGEDALNAEETAALREALRRTQRER